VQLKNNLEEQAMRQILQYSEGYQKVSRIDTLTVAKMTRFMEREYKISYATVPDREKANIIHDAIIKENAGLNEIIRELFGIDSLPHRVVKWHEAEHDLVLKTIFTKEYKKGDIVGPIQFSDD